MKKPAESGLLPGFQYPAGVLNAYASVPGSALCAVTNQFLGISGTVPGKTG